MKRILLILMSLLLLVPYGSLAESPISVLIDGEKQSYKQPPVNQNGTTLVPLRGIFEGLGAKVEWDGTTQTVTANKDCINVVLTIGSTSPKVNGVVKPITVPGQIVNGSTLVPLRFVSEALGSDVKWDGSTSTISITSKTVDCSGVVKPTTNRVQATVVSVTDGDTVKVNIGGKEEGVRLLLVDTPETVHPTIPDQPFGKEASDFTKSILTAGKNVELEYDKSERDKYDRVLAYLWVDGKNFNQMLLDKGFARLAYIYEPPYKYYDSFLDSQNRAKANKYGIWSIAGYVTEDGFNSANGENNSSSTPIKEDSTQQKSKVDLSKSDYNCSDFKTQAEAQAVFEAAGGLEGKDPYKLDRDGDKRVCESLR